MKPIFPNRLFRLLLGCLLLAGCTRVVPLDEACKGDEIAEASVEGNILIDFCNQADDGQIMCVFYVADEGEKMPVVLRTITDSPWPLGIYPKLSAETVKGLMCGDREDCSQGENNTRFRVTGECNPIKHNLFVKGFKNIKPLN